LEHKLTVLASGIRIFVYDGCRSVRIGSVITLVAFGRHYFYYSLTSCQELILYDKPSV
jgi:hypothetical protein